MQQPMESPARAPIDLTRVRDALVPVLAAHGVAFVDLEWLTEQVGWTLRLTIEREGTSDAGGGVTLEDCANVSRDASSVLDAEEDLIPSNYNLEVSSPGLDRRLRTPAELARFAGRTVKVKLSRPAPDGQRVLRGELQSAAEGRVAVMVDGKRIEVAFGDVVEARLVFELSPQPKKKGHGRSRGASAEAGARPASKRSSRSSETRK